MTNTDYLPNIATLAEATAWLEARTGEPWPLARVIESGLRPWVWLNPDPSGGPQDPLMVHVFEGRSEGYLAPVVFLGDTYRLATARDGVLSMTRTPSGRVFKITPPPTIPIEELRFKGDEIRELAERLAERQQATSEVARPSGQRWTDDDREALRAYKDEHGTKAAAEHFGVSAQRVRKLLADDQKNTGASLGHSAFTYRPK